MKNKTPESQDKKKVVEVVGKRRRTPNRKQRVPFDPSLWKPKTSLGMKVKSGEFTDIDEATGATQTILEAQIVDTLLPNAKTELLMIGQSKGKFGGGQRRVFRQTQKKTREGNKPRFATFSIIGNENGYIGYGSGKSKETVPAREKAIRKSKLNIFKIARGCGSWECNCATPHSIPFEVKGKSGSVKITLIPAPKGTGLCIETECAKILEICGIKDVWSKTKGHTKTKFNLILACIAALKQLMQVKVKESHIKELGIVYGKVSVPVEEKDE